MMFVNMRRIRKCKVLRITLMCLATSMIMIYWEQLDNKIVTHVKSFMYRYLPNSFKFINASFTISPKEAIKFSNHRYIINQQRKCVKRDILLLLFVKSSTENFGRRQAIRSTWGNEAYIERTLGVTVKVLFAVGLHPEPQQRRKLQLQLFFEDQIYHDLIQQDFIDSFHNLTLKLLLQLGWKETFCHHAQFLMSADDDVFVHIPNLIHYLQGIARSNVEDLWIGRVHRGSPPERDKESKYYVSRDMYPWLSYPDYTPGSGYVLSKSVATKIYQASLTLNASLHIDDVFLGICAKMLGISPKNHLFFSGEGKAPYHRCIYNQMMTSHGHVRDIHELWKLATEPDVGQMSSGLFWKLYCTMVKVRLLCTPFSSVSYPCMAAFWT
ncbi:lactosylceramide 1,3-N-acetyl-beta-D-glucosaminyltransferase B [Myxocyprinus asiaticus]|uniref:lactosylceramide 1,3-N-acetyl-beta-D-glucosaminyltransferase B n=1 Tax=Myxocyprinus asiaticus TaxID=70543 RepID=UPI002221FA20|nr:lactosylceramide 1,3-N-acetyl-beta-D-glucosaminyltransferase B [Myxocyprinus asiaticus]XP_051553223.1 lactosylceramide 1,3-N-acetyl-beta-D-glucosaminyltransferase B [Myxocyprinus asiaticus]XP_051553224.1 lactosylceramide 1,3-N-acetyl-beta-D-glucosaminyltransferase B [Myxocyprinus asiaticus]